MFVFSIICCNFVAEIQNDYDMTAIQLRAELLRELNPIFDSETAMRQALAALRDILTSTSEAMKHYLVFLILVVMALPCKIAAATVADSLQTDTIISLDEVVAKGSRRHLRQQQNFAGLAAPRGIAEGDPFLERATTMRELLHRLGIRTVINENGEEEIGYSDAGAVFVDNVRQEADETVELLRMSPANVKSVEYFPKNNAQNGIFAVRPKSWSGVVPGALFVFLKDGSEMGESRKREPQNNIGELGQSVLLAVNDQGYPIRPDLLEAGLRDSSLYVQPKVAGRKTRLCIVYGEGDVLVVKPQKGQILCFPTEQLHPGLAFVGLVQTGLEDRPQVLAVRRIDIP